MAHRKFSVGSSGRDSGSRNYGYGDLYDTNTDHDLLSDFLQFIIDKLEVLTDEEGLRDCDEWNFNRGSDITIRRIGVNGHWVYFCQWFDLRGNNIYLPTATPPNPMMVALMSGFYLYSNAKTAKGIIQYINRQRDKKAFCERLKTLLVEGRPR